MRRVYRVRRYWPRKRRVQRHVLKRDKSVLTRDNLLLAPIFSSLEFSEAFGSAVAFFFPVSVELAQTAQSPVFTTPYGDPGKPWNETRGVLMAEKLLNNTKYLA